MPKVAPRLNHATTLPAVGRGSQRPSLEGDSSCKSDTGVSAAQFYNNPGHDEPHKHLEHGVSSDDDFSPRSLPPGLNALEQLLGQKSERQGSKERHAGKRSLFPITQQPNVRRSGSSQLSGHLASNEASRWSSLHDHSIVPPQAMRGPHHLLRAATHALKLARHSMRVEPEDTSASILPSLSQLAAGNFSLLPGLDTPEGKLESKSTVDQTAKGTTLPPIEIKIEGPTNEKLKSSKKSKKKSKASKKQQEPPSDEDEEMDTKSQQALKARANRRRTMQNLCKAQEAVKRADSKSLERISRPRATIESADSKALDSLAASMSVMSMSGTNEKRFTLTKLDKRIDQLGVNDSSDKRVTADSPTKAAGDESDAEMHADKRLLMVKNARLIQQTLQDIPDEATRCHDKFLKKLAAKEKKQDDASGTRIGHRFSNGVVDARMEQEVKKVGHKLRKQRRDQVLARLGRHTDGLPTQEQQPVEKGSRRMETLTSLRSQQSKQAFEEKLAECMREGPHSSESDSSMLSSRSGSSSSSISSSHTSSALTCSNSKSDSEVDVRDTAGGSKTAHGDCSLISSKKASLADVVEVSGCGNLFIRQVTSLGDKLSQRLLTAPPGSRNRHLFNFDEALDFDVGFKEKDAANRPGTTPGCLQQWLDISTVFQEVLRQRELVRLAALDLERALESKKLEPLAKQTFALAPAKITDRAKDEQGKTTIQVEKAENLQAKPSASARQSSAEVLPASVAARLKLTVQKRTTVRVQSPHSSENVSTFSSDSDSNSPRSTKHSGTKRATPSAKRNTKSSESIATGSSDAARRYAKKHLPEVPRLRSLFHDHTKILHDDWMVRAQTIKRYHLEAAERLGLEEQDLSVDKIYEISVRDLVNAAEAKEQNRLHKAALRVQVQWRLLLWVRKVAKERKRKRHAVVTLQRWWHNRVAFRSPIDRKVAYRPVIDNAKARIAASVLGWWVRKKTQTQRDCHSLKWQLTLMQHQLGIQDVVRFVRVQAQIRSFLARKRVQEMLAQRRLAELNAAFEVQSLQEPPRLQSGESKLPGSRRVSDVCVEKTTKESFADITKRRRGTIMVLAGQTRSERRASRMSVISNASGYNTLQVISSPSLHSDFTLHSDVSPVSLAVPSPPPPPSIDPRAPVATLEMYKHKPAFSRNPVVPLATQRRRPGQNFLMGKLGGLRPNVRQKHFKLPQVGMTASLGKDVSSSDVK